jgi:hypothetical protein
VVAAKLTSWLALAAVAGLRLAGLGIPPTLQLACAFVAAPITAAAAMAAALAIPRGPRVISFERRDAAWCTPGEASAIRDAAQLRGTMGGAGHVHPARLAFAVAAWAGAALSGVELLSTGMLELADPWPLALAVAAAFAALLFPARPFWYREVTGGGVLVTPPVTAALVVARSLRDGGRSAEPRQET